MTGSLNWWGLLVANEKPTAKDLSQPQRPQTSLPKRIEDNNNWAFHPVSFIFSLAIPWAFPVDPWLGPLNQPTTYNNLVHHSFIHRFQQDTRSVLFSWPVGTDRSARLNWNCIHRSCLFSLTHHTFTQHLRKPLYDCYFCQSSTKAYFLLFLSILSIDL